MIEIGDVEPVYLNRNDLVQWTSGPKLKISERHIIGILDVYPDGSTELKSQVGLSKIDEAVGNYRLVGSASEYVADVALVPSGQEFRFDADEPMTNDPEPVSLFDGNISIYHYGRIPGTKIDGFDLVKSGEIWGAIPHFDLKVESGGLMYYVFEGDVSSSRVEQILRGYLLQDQAENQREFNARHSEYQSGARDRDFLRRHPFPPL